MGYLPDGGKQIGGEVASLGEIHKSNGRFEKGDRG